MSAECKTILVGETGSWDSLAMDCYGQECVHMATFSVPAVHTQIQKFDEMNEDSEDEMFIMLIMFFALFRSKCVQYPSIPSLAVSFPEGKLSSTVLYHSGCYFKCIPLRQC
jgi:hypothetical protein